MNNNLFIDLQNKVDPRIFFDYYNGVPLYDSTCVFKITYYTNTEQFMLIEEKIKAWLSTNQHFDFYSFGCACSFYVLKREMMGFCSAFGVYLNCDNVNQIWANFDLLTFEHKGNMEKITKNDIILKF